ncbi:MAG: hypothetical protein LQ340_007689 [Diploschistes diacapsis]|nr:MAG: hypothetical protein LQ340_007689 [Diploschistes diacapsis]
MQLITILALAPFLGATLAAPNQHEKFHHAKRQNPMVTVTDLVVVTDIITTTVWAAPGAAQSSSAPAIPSPVSPAPVSSSPASSSSSATPTTSSGLVALQNPTPTPSPSTSSTTVAAAQFPSPPPAPAPSSVAAPAPSPASGNGDAPAGSTLPGASVSVPACDSSSPCTGDATFYAVGLGACGQTSDPSEMIVAVPDQVMGSLSSGSDMNPLCGKKVSITLIDGVGPVTATVMDKCGGCDGPYDLDMSTGLFSALGGDSNAGRYTNMTWTWA